MIQCLKRSNSDNTSTFLKSSDIFNLERTKKPERSALKLGSNMRSHELSTHWEQFLKKLCLKKVLSEPSPLD